MKPFSAALPLLVLVSCLPAYAEGASPVVSPWSDLAMQIILMTASAVISLAIAFGVELVRRWTGIQVESKQREALHSAAMTGVNLALAKYGPAIGLKPNGRTRVVDDASDWVLRTGAPGAVLGLRLSEEDVRKVVESKVGALASVSASAHGAAAGAAQPKPSPAL